MISHLNVIANIMQIRWHDSVGREVQGVETQITLGLLPLSHIYGLVVIALASIYKGDGVIILPRYEFKSLLETIQKYKINYLYLVRTPTFPRLGIHTGNVTLNPTSRSPQSSSNCSAAPTSVPGTTSAPCGTCSRARRRWAGRRTWRCGRRSRAGRSGRGTG